MMSRPLCSLVPFVLMTLGLAGCSVVRSGTPIEGQRVGSYAGRLPDGRALTLDLAWWPAGLGGAASIDGSPAAFVQRGGQRVAGEILLSSGDVLPVFVDLAAGGVVSVTTEIGTSRLDSVDAEAAWPASGLSGRYVAKDLLSPVGSATLHVAGAVAWGHASVWGRDALIAAWVQTDDSLRGDLVFGDSSGVEFRAWSAEGGGLRISTGGAPVTLRRAGP